MAYLDVIEGYPKTAEAQTGVYELVGMLKGTDNERLNEVEAAFPPVDSLRTAEARLVIGNYYQFRGKRGKVAGDAGAAKYYFGLTRDIAWDTMLRYPNDPLQVLAVDAYVSAVEEEGPAPLAEAARRLEELIASQEPNFTTWASHLLLGSYLPREHRDADATLHFASMIDALDNGFVQKALEDPGTLGLLKAWIAYGLGRAYMKLEVYPQALQYYRLAMELFPIEAEEVFRLAAFESAYVTYKQDPNAANEAIALFEQFLQYEGTLYKDRALLEVAALYAHQGEYSTAYIRLQQLVKEYPESEVLDQARQSMDFFEQHLLNAAQVMGGTKKEIVDPLILAKACGPIALQKILVAQGIPSRLEELMMLAGTDGDGTTMSGLVEAATAKGVTLTGVEASDCRDLACPFIAFVDGNHFVLIRSVKDDGVLVEDVAIDPEKVTHESFAARWNGFALVSGDPNGQPQIELTALRSAKGGWVPGLGDEQEEAPAPPSTICPTDSGALLAFPGARSSGPGSVGGGGAGVGPSPFVALPGAIASPTAWVGISSPGVNPRINTFRTSLMLSETDLRIPVRGGVNLAFVRSYANPDGFHRAEFKGTTKPWRNIIGDGWTHSYNMFLRTSGGTTPSQVAFFDETGAHRYYTYSNSDTTYDYYQRSSTGSFGEKGNVLKRVKADGRFILELPVGLTYFFSPPTTDSAAYSRLNRIMDESGNNIWMTYDGAIGVGRLTKVAGTAGDVQHLAFTYSGNLITKVELKSNTTVLQTYQYGYTNNELTSVTDNDSNTVSYTYGSAAGVTNSRYISSITDKRNNTAYFTWTYTSGKAYKIVVQAPSGLYTTYERDLTTNKCTITNSDGTTNLTKFVNHPVAGNLSRSGRKDFYLDLANNIYESWLYEYTVESGTNYNVETVKTPQNSLGQHVVASVTKYDNKGRVVSQRVGASGPVTTYTYSGTNPSPATMTDPAGIVTTYTFDTSNRLTKVQHPAFGTGNSYDYTYDTYGHLASETNPEGDVTQYGYNSYGRLTSVTVDPTGLNFVTSMTYDDFGNMVTVTDPRNNTTTYEYATGCTTCAGSGGELTSITDPLSNVTEFEYDANGNMTKVIDALLRETDYAYDSMNNLTTVTSPSGSTNTMTMAYNVLGLLESRTDFEGKTTEYEYDYIGRLVSEIDATQTPLETIVAYVFNYFGGLDSVTDGLNHSTFYDYNAAFQLTKVTDAINKQTHYTYDTAGRVTKAAAGTTGTVDPTEYFFSSTTGLLTKVRYTSGSSSYDADYTYDNAARPVKIADWINATNGIQYAYDAAGRLSTITDYDSSTLTYGYDAASNVTSMTDYHNNTVSYTYDAANQLYTLTAPGSKTWTYTYNALGQPTQVDIPNGMHTSYTYDTRNRLSAIDHMDGTTTKQAFDYTLDDNGNITKITHEDGSFWDYGYDGRDRLTSADRKSSSGNILAAYAYTYDDADNMLTKVEPYEDDFEDGATTGWSTWAGTWSASGGMLVKTDTGVGYLGQANTDADIEVKFDYRFTSTSGGDYGHVPVRWESSDDYLSVLVTPTSLELRSAVSGTVTTLDTATVSTTPNQWYTLRVQADGADVTVWRSTEGELETEVLSSTSGAPLTTSYVALGLYNSTTSDSPFQLDNIRVLSDSLSNSYTFTYNNANELTSMAGPNGTTSFTYDAWGRQITQTLNSVTDSYAYRYGSKLYSVDLANDTTIDVTFDYGGDQKRRSTTEGASTTWYNWDGWNIINEEDASGTLARMHVGPFAQVAGPNPATGAYAYHLHDHLGSTRALYDQSKSLVASYAYTPYGQNYVSFGSTPTSRRFTGHDWNETSGLYFAPYRFYAPETARWTATDPLGGQINLYAYCFGNPVSVTDPLGLWGWDRDYIQYGIGGLLGFGPQGSFGAAWYGFAEGYSRAGQGVANAFTGGLFNAESGLFYDTFNEQWRSLGMEGNECDSAFQSGMLGGRFATGTLALAGVVMYGTVGLPSELIHYTTAEGARGIAADAFIRGGWGLFGRGVYLARIGRPLNLFVRVNATESIVISTPPGTIRIIPRLIYFVRGRGVGI